MREIAAFLESNEEIQGTVTTIVQGRGDSDTDPFKIADHFVEQRGFNPIGRDWRVIDEDSAITLLTRLLHLSLVYGVEMMREKTARHIAKCFRDFFDSYDVTFMSSGEFDGTVTSWSPLTNATMNMAVVLFDSHKIGMICMEDED